MSPTYPIHGLARDVRLTHPLRNAFAEELERRRLSDLTAYQRDMAAQRHQAAYHYHAAYHQETVPNGRQDYHANAESPRAFGRPVSSWSYVNDHNNNNRFQGTLQSSPRPESFPGYDPATAHIATVEFLLPLNDPLLDGIPEEIDDPGVDYSELHRVLAQVHLDIMSKRDRDAAFPDTSPSSELTRARRAARAQQVLQDLASKYSMTRRTELNQQALPRPSDLSYEPNVSHRADRNPTDLVNPGNLSSNYNMDRRTALDQQALPRPGNLSSESTVPRRTDRNISTPLRFDENSAEFTPRRRIEHNQPTFLPQRTDYVNKAAGNDAMVMSTGPMIPTRDGSYAATGMPRTVHGRQINSMMAQLDCSSPSAAAVFAPVSPPAAVFGPVSPLAAVLAPGSDQYTIDQLIKRMDRFQMKQEADNKLIRELMEAQKTDREEIEALKGGTGEKKVEVEREIGDGWYPRN